MSTKEVSLLRWEEQPKSVNWALLFYSESPLLCYNLSPKL